jgi:beta-lactamase superfamily II metal-dependent hydrolase
MATDIRYAAFPSALVFESAKAGAKVVKQLLWGDWVRITGQAQGAFTPVHARGCNGFMRTATLQDERLLELVFVDIGQGDGCLMVTPDDKLLVIDAGAGDNMLRFLKWRFSGFAKRFVFEAAILSHSDLDHYGGFQGLFDEPNVFFKSVYTNGFMERQTTRDTDILGARVKHNGAQYITSLVTDLASLDAFLADSANFKGKKYPTMLKAARNAGKFADYRMLSVADRFVPGFSPGDSAVELELLGPILEDVDGRKGLRWFGDVGKTKNGHSVAVRVRYRGVTIFAGGDLNIPSESLLLKHHAGAAAFPVTEADRLALVDEARPKLSAHFAKACHHGSGDVSRAFLTAVNPLGTIISSGDDEAFSHPRADTLGTIGKCSRGDRPAIFCTELARSAPERIKHPRLLHAELDDLVARLKKALTPAEEKKVNSSIASLKKSLERSIAVYGAINLRTDGARAVVAQKIEKPRNPQAAWDIYQFDRADSAAELTFVSKHDDD